MLLHVCQGIWKNMFGILLLVKTKDLEQISIKRRLVKRIMAYLCDGV